MSCYGLSLVFYGFPFSCFHTKVHPEYALLHARMKIAYSASGSVQFNPMRKMFSSHGVSSNGNDVIFKYIYTKAGRTCHLIFLFFMMIPIPVGMAFPVFLLFHSFWELFFEWMKYFYFNKEGSRKQFNILIHIYLFSVFVFHFCVMNVCERIEIRKCS